MTSSKNHAAAKRAFVTAVTCNFAHYAKVVLGTVSKHHPEADRFVCFTDRPPRNWGDDFNGHKVFYADEFGIKDWHRFAFQYTPFELTCALKPYAIKSLLRLGYDEVFYVDGDMQLFGDLTEVIDHLSEYSIVLTPHLLKPLPDDGKRPNESVYLRSGAYNAGFIAVRNDENANSFLDWWQSMVRCHCYVDIASGFFVDQKWLDLVPGLFRGVSILRHPGYNAGHWTLSQCVISDASSETSESRITVDGLPVVLFHFSGMTLEKPLEYLRQQTRTSLDQIPGLARIVEQYHGDLHEAGSTEYTKWGCCFSSLTDGTPIHASWREAIRRNYKIWSEIANPFDLCSSRHLAAQRVLIQKKAIRWRRDWSIDFSRNRGLFGALRKAINLLRKAVRKK
jgi:hypothetical protein